MRTHSGARVALVNVSKSTILLTDENKSCALTQLSHKAFLCTNNLAGWIYFRNNFFNSNIMLLKRVSTNYCHWWWRVNDCVLLVLFFVYVLSCPSFVLSCLEQPCFVLIALRLLLLSLQNTHYSLQLQLSSWTCIIYMIMIINNYYCKVIKIIL